MAGILNPKNRIIDFILTDTGKEQLRNGQLKPEFASYTDLHTFYEGTGGTADDASTRILLEGFRRVQDKITPEALPDGRLTNFQSGDLKIFDAGILSGTSGQIFDPIVGITSFNQFLSGSADNFSQNRILSETDELEGDVSFSLSRGSVSLPRLTPNLGLLLAGSDDGGLSGSDLDSAETPLVPVPLDKRFSGVTNYLYRPPEDLIPTEDRNNQSKNALNEYLSPDPRPFGTTYEDESQRLTLARTFKQRSEALYGSATIDIQSKEHDDVLIQGYLQIGGTELTKYVIIPLASESDRSIEYFLLGKMIPQGDGTESFVDALMLVIKK